MEQQYEYCTNIRDQKDLRDGFNELTRKTFCFDFTTWYQMGQWNKYKYIPHVLICNDKVVSNVSANVMQFYVNGQIKKYIQLGTVMTDPEYRGQGFNRYLMEAVLEEYAGKVDGIYLFGNDSVLDYYPKFGFRAVQEHSFGITNDSEKWQQTEPYALKKADMQNKDTFAGWYDTIVRSDRAGGDKNPEDAFYMFDNVGLYEFWLSHGYGDKVYYIPETDSYVIADVKDAKLTVYQTFGNCEIDIFRLKDYFAQSTSVSEIELGYTPVRKDIYTVKAHKEADCTLFVIGDKLNELEAKKCMFPILSHA